MSIITGAVAFWKFDESSGNASDSVGSNTLVNNATVTYAAGKINNGASFVAASSQFFSIVDNVPLSLTGDCSFSFWIKPSTLDADVGIIDKSVSAGNQISYDMRVNMSGTHSFKFGVSNTGAAGAYVEKVVNLLSSLVTGTFYHFVAIYTASLGKIEVYVNNVSQGSATGLPTSIFNATTALNVGRYQNGSSNYVNGMLDAVGIWSEALTASDVAILYSNGNGTQYPFSQTISLSDTSVSSDSLSILGKGVISVSDTSISSDSQKTKYGFQNQSKHSSSWSNQSKS